MLPLSLQHHAAPARGTGNAPTARNGRGQCRRAEVTRKRRLSRKELLRRALTLCHRVQTILPDRRRIGVRHRIGERVDEEICLRRRREHLLFARRVQESAPYQILDNARTRRLCADAGDIAQHLLRRFVLDVFVDLLHALQESRGGKACGRLRLARAELCGHIVRCVALFHRRQDGTFFVLFLRILLIFRRAVHRTPPCRTLRASARSKQLAVVGDLHLRLVIDVVRMELCNVGACNQLVDVPLHRTEPREVHGHGRRDNRVVRGDLRVVPRA